MREMLSVFLESAGHRVVSAADGREGLQILAEQPIDVVFTDILMPEKDGLEFISDARQIHPGLPIIAISGGGTVMSTEYCLRAAKSFGATGVVQKPFSRDELFAALEKALGENAERI
jgi:CheY-like chemotaxis protein